MKSPALISIVLCDTILRDAFRPEKTTLHGLFNQIFSKSYPAVHAQMVVLVEVRDLNPKSRAALVIHPANKPDRPIFEAVLSERPEDDGSSVVGLQFGIQGLQIPSAGEYRVVFMVDGNAIGERALVATKIDEDESGKGDE